MPSEANHPNSGLLFARRVLTQVPGLDGDAVWWESGRIRAVGSGADLERRVPSRVPRYDFRNSLVTPGFTDGHTHFAMWALGRGRVHLAGCGSRREAIRRVENATPVDGWIVGHGWDSNGWNEAPDRWSLDQVQTVPVVLDSLDVHSAWVNSAALKSAGIDRDTADPFGGRIVRDGTGEPTGLLLERAVELVIPFLPNPKPTQLLEAVLEAQSEAHRLGITGIHDVEGPDALRAFRTMDRDNRLRLRVLFHPPVARLRDLVASGAQSGQGSEWLRLGGIKLFLDGSLGSRTAWMLEPYEDGRDRGMPITSEVLARQAMQTAAAAGIACAVHAIGDAAVRRALDLISALPRVAIPHRIEHLQCVHPTDLARAASAGIVASMQPAHILVDIPNAERQWGERSSGAYAFRSLLSLGTTLAFGSDVPVASIDPRPGVFAAMERRTPTGNAQAWYAEQRLTFAETVRAYTLGNAVAGGTAQRSGALGMGMDADLVAWAVDPAIDHEIGEAFHAGHAVLTVVAGEAVMVSPA